MCAIQTPSTFEKTEVPLARIQHQVPVRRRGRRGCVGQPHILLGGEPSFFQSPPPRGLKKAVHVVGVHFVFVSEVWYFFGEMPPFSLSGMKTTTHSMWYPRDVYSVPVCFFRRHVLVE